MLYHPLLLLDLLDGDTVGSFRVLTLREAAINVLNEGDLLKKASLTFYYVNCWENRFISEITSSAGEKVPLPDQPRRPNSNPTLPKSKSMSRNAIEISIHGIAHAESYAIDLFWDCIARFVHCKMPRQFYDELVHIAGQEASHFMSWYERLERSDCPYGSLSTHDGLWRSAAGTAL